MGRNLEGKAGDSPEKACALNAEVIRWLSTVCRSEGKRAVRDRGRLAEPLKGLMR